MSASAVVAMLWTLPHLAHAAPLGALEAAPVRTLVTAAHVLNVRGRRDGPMDVVLADGRIEATLPVGAAWEVQVDRVVNGTGHTLMPGLIDAHVHVSSTPSLPRQPRVPSLKHTLGALLDAGVTTVLDPGLSREDADRIERRRAAGRLDAPRVYTAGKPFAAPGGHPWASIQSAFPGPLVRMAIRRTAWPVATAEEVDRAVGRQGITPFIKVVIDSIPRGAPTITDEALGRLRTAATALGSRLLAHVGRPEDLDRALAVPVDALAHAPWAGRISDAQIAGLARRQIPVTPTLTVWRASGDAHHGRFPDDPLSKRLLPPRVAQDVADATARGGARSSLLSPWMESLGAAEHERLDNLSRLRGAGVPIQLGSDTPIFGVPVGAGTHLELAALVEAGLSREEALTSATIGNARFLDPRADFGAVEPGWQADLLLVPGDPTAVLSVVAAATHIWSDGRLWQRR